MLRVFIGFILLCIISCSSKEGKILLLERAESVMAAQPDSALSILNNLKFTDLKKDRDKAKFALLLSEALDKNYIDITSDSIIEVAVSYYGKKSSSTDKAKTYYYLGRVYENAKKFEKSVNAYKDADRFVNKGDHNLKGLILTSIGYLYIYQKSWENALPAFEKAGNEFIKSENFKNLSYILKCEGLSLFMLNDYTNALSKYNESFDIATNLNDTSHILSLAGSIASILCYQQDDIKGAKRLLTGIYEKYNNSLIDMDAHALWGYILLKEGDFENAEKYFHSANNIEITHHHLISFYGLNTMLYKEQGDYQSALRYSELGRELSDSIHRVEKNSLIQDFERRYETKHLKEVNRSLKTKHRYQALTIILLLIIIAFTARKVIRDKREKEREKTEYNYFIERMTQDYEQIKNKYNSLFKHSSKQDQKVGNLKEALAERLVAVKNLVELVSTAGSNTDLFLERFKKYMRLEAGKNKRLFSDLHDLMNIHYNGIIDHLKKEYPQLTKEDLNFCSLVFLNIPVSGIQLMCNYTNIDSLYNRRSKLRQRLHLSSDANLESFLSNLLEKQHRINRV